MQEDAKVILTKAAVARRQIDAAIRIWFAYEDDLAVYTVAAAAYGVRGLMESSGKPAGAHFAAVGIYAYAKQVIDACSEECLPKEFGDLEKEIIRNVIQHIISGEILDSEDLTYTWDKITESRRWKGFNLPANFLKHADRDPASILFEDKIDVQDIIFRACGTYVYIFKDSSPEMMLFYWHSLAVSDEIV